jgi:hypothetical protein
MARKVRISTRKIAEQGSAYSDQFIGLRVMHKTFSEGTLVGTVEGFGPGGYATVRFDDGRWARAVRGDYLIAV